MMKLFLIFFVLHTTTSSITYDDEAFDLLNEMIRKHDIFDIDATKLIDFAKEYGLSNVSALTQFTGNLSDSCTYTLEQKFLYPATRYILSKNITGLKKWLTTSQVLMYLDAWPKIPSRILLGNTGWYGAYDECQSLQDAHYCIADMKLLDNNLLAGFYGSCVPKNCSNKDVFILLQLTKPFLQKIIDFPEIGSLSKIGGPVLCNDKEPLPADTVGFIVVLSILVALCVLGTLIEGIQDCCTPEQLIPQTEIINDNSSDQKQINGSIHYQKFGVDNIERIRGNMFVNFLICFSIIKNSKSILSTKTAPGVIECLNGMRAISMTWVILGHIYFFSIYVKIDNLLISSEVLQRFNFQAIANAYVSVDSFFLLSGLLVAYISLKKMDATEGRLGLTMYYVHRFVRLTPSYLFSIFVYTSVYPYIIDSPLGIVIKNTGNENCRKYWWTNLLYINNFYPQEFGSECLAWSWYLANDMQFYIISPIFLYIMYRFKLRGALISTGCGILACVIITGSIIGAKDLPSLISEAWAPAERNNPEYLRKVGLFSNDVYIKPYTRIAPYLVGLLVGFLLSRKIYFTRKPNAILAIPCWMVATTIGMAVIYGPYSVFKVGGNLLTQSENIMYGAFSRFAWALALAWVVYACHNKMGGIINNFLSWKAWIVLSRLTYGAYLLHPIIISYYYNSLQNPLHYQDDTTIFRFLSVLVVSYSLSFVMMLLVDVPVFNIEKFLIKMFSKPKNL